MQGDQQRPDRQSAAVALSMTLDVRLCYGLLANAVHATLTCAALVSCAPALELSFGSTSCVFVLASGIRLASMQVVRQLTALTVAISPPVPHDAASYRMTRSPACFVRAAQLQAVQHEEASLICIDSSQVSPLAQMVSSRHQRQRFSQRIDHPILFLFLSSVSILPAWESQGTSQLWPRLKGHNQGHLGHPNAIFL